MNLENARFTPNYIPTLEPIVIETMKQYKVKASMLVINSFKNIDDNEDLNPSSIFKFCTDVEDTVSFKVLVATMNKVNNFRSDVNFNIIKSLGESHPLFKDKDYIFNFINEMQGVKTKLLRKTLVQCFQLWNQKKMFFVYEKPGFVLQWLQLKDYPLHRIPIEVIQNDTMFKPIVKAYYPHLNETNLNIEFKFLQKSLL